ncbi:M20/M25/M40 family metallo-hydrolase [Streptomyces chumphonensis]|uniref:M20/M25/M40 family metallo-hydrolase n=1 Tax=Streptomyces chumphonensis TaxID=1214925 RepID=UPI003D716498
MAERAASGAHIDERALEEVVAATADLIRMDTTNRGGGEGCERPAAEYVAERLADAGVEPRLLEKAPGRTNVVARIPGTDPTADAVLVHGHLDVVPADAAEWSVHPFSGELRDGCVWGRGAIDMKNMDAMALTVVRAWARAGVRPRRDVVLAFTADEEDTAEYGAGYLVEQHAELFEGCTEGLSESGAFTFHTDTGLRLYPVGAGERGTAWLRLTAHGRAGHGSKIHPDNAVTRLAAAVTRIGEHTWPVHLTPTVRAALRRLAELHGVDAGGLDGPDAGGAAEELLGALGSAADLIRPVLRNSGNPTMLDAGYKVNVIPGRAGAHVDGRMLPGAEEDFARTLDVLTGDGVDWEFQHREIPLEAPVDNATFATLCEALEHFDPGAHAVPWCLTGGTDAKQFSRLGIDGYGFSPLRLPPGFDYGALFHGVDERVPVDALHFGVRALDRALLSL